MAECGRKSPAEWIPCEMPQENHGHQAILRLKGLQRCGPPEGWELRRQLLKQQLLLYGRLARSSNDDVLRQLTFIPDSVRAATGRYVRRVGRPRNEWAVMLDKEARKMHADPSTIINDHFLWRRPVVAYCV